jgi:hypothetical protein
MSNSMNSASAYGFGLSYQNTRPVKRKSTKRNKWRTSEKRRITNYASNSYRPALLSDFGHTIKRVELPEF